MSGRLDERVLRYRNFIMTPQSATHDQGHQQA